MGRRSKPAARQRFLNGYPFFVVNWVQINTADLTCAQSEFALSAFLFLFDHFIRGPPLSILPCTPRQKGKQIMKRINLKDFYPFYQEDYFIDVSDALAELFRRDKAKEDTLRRKQRFHHAYFSLDRNDGIEKKIVYVSRSPEEIYERKITREQLHAAMESLTNRQARRIYAHFFLGISKADIARNEGVRTQLISESIDRGLKRIEYYLKTHD